MRLQRRPQVQAQARARSSPDPRYLDCLALPATCLEWPATEALLAVTASRTEYGAITKGTITPASSKLRLFNSMSPFLDHNPPAGAATIATIPTIMTDERLLRRQARLPSRHRLLLPHRLLRQGTRRETQILDHVPGQGRALLVPVPVRQFH